MAGSRALTAVAVACVLALLCSACSNDGESTGGTTGLGRVEAGRTPAAAEQLFADVAHRIDTFVDAEDLEGASLVVVGRDEGVVFEHFAGTFKPERISLIASATKMVSAGVLLRLQDEGLLDLDAPVADSVPWGAGNPDVSVAQLLSNSSGLPGLADGTIYPPHLCEYLAAGSLSECGETIFTTEADDADVVPPDTRFRYGGGQWQVAGAIAEAVSGKTWAELVEETYVEPCGLGTLAYNNHFAQLRSPDGPLSYPPQFSSDPTTLAPTDNPNIEGGAYTTARDYAQLLLMHLRGGRCGDESVLTEDSVDQAHTDRLGPWGTGQAYEGYGLGWWIDRDDPDHQRDGGAYGTVPWIDLGRGYAAVLVLESTGPRGRRLAEEIRPIVADSVDQLREEG